VTAVVGQWNGAVKAIAGASPARSINGHLLILLSGVIAIKRQSHADMLEVPVDGSAGSR
jgi:hypothetical protein